jgi:hypothetical protein
VRRCEAGRRKSEKKEGEKVRRWEGWKEKKEKVKG